MSEFSNLVRDLIESGEDPNVLAEELEESVGKTGLWILWGDGSWEQNMVCSKCGSSSGGICNDGGTIGPPYTGDPGYHKNQPGVKMIPQKEWNERQSKC